MPVTRSGELEQIDDTDESNHIDSDISEDFETEYMTNQSLRN
jgi:hypothetical protein